jgi:ATP-dependent RNA helicase DDX5/DBP2
VAIAPTGTGKTLGYLLPAIVHITAQEPVRPTDLSPIGLIIVPTRELAQQVMEQAAVYGSSITDLGFEALKPVCLYGGTKRDVQRSELSDKHPDLIVATPGRLIDFLSDGTINLSRVTYFVVDEVDRLIAIDGKQRLHLNGFVEDMKYVSSLIRPGRQCVMCSATCAPDVLDLARELCGNEPVFFQVAESDKVERLVVNSNIEQHFAVAGDFEEDRLRFLMDNVLPTTFTETLGRVEQKMMIFVNSKDRVDRVTEALRAAGWPAIGFHGDKNQWERDWIFENFKTGVCNILVATDVMGRGMDFDDVRAVVNFELPDTIESYVHRVGRTGRFGKKILKGYALSFLTKRDWFILPGLEQLLGDSGLEVPDILAERVAEYRTYEKNTRRW